jgi:GH35 family endo-1,4-beta-xylanase
MYYETGKLDQSSLSVVYAILEQKPWTKDNQKAWQNAMDSAGKKDKVGKAYNVAKAFDQEDKLALNENAIIKTDESKSTGILQDSIRKGGRGLTLVAALNRLASVKQMNQLSTSEVSEIIADLGKQGQFGERKKIALEILLQIVL